MTTRHDQRTSPLKLATARGLKWSGRGSLAKLNDQLKDTIYAQPTWRRIQSIADIRNKAAHGDVQAVNVDDVRDAMSFIPRVMTNYPS